MTQIMKETPKYETQIDLSNKNNSQTQLIQLTGHNKKVLEVGPATGYVSEVLQGHGCTVTGIELDGDAAKLAERFCERMIVRNVEELDFQQTFGDERFDVAMFGDVLEHLVDPQSVLERVRAILAPAGYVVASVPNIAHASIRLALIKGEFRYTQLGLLDRTHLRFFTRDTLGDLFRDAGYTIRVWRRVQLGAFGTEQDLRTEDYPPYLSGSISEDPDSLTYQFVVKAQVREKPLALNGHNGRPRVGAPAGANPALASLWRVDERTRDLERNFAVRAERLRRQQERLAEQERRITELEQHAGNLRHQINLITGSLGYRLVERVRGVIRFFAPPGSPQRIPLIAVRRSMRLVRRRGPLALLEKIVKAWKWPDIIGRLSRAPSPIMDLNTQYLAWLKKYGVTDAKARHLRQEAAALTYAPTVSILTPVYNPEPSWLRDAIESVRNQVYENWELCLTDDGSTRTGVRTLLEEYTRKDRRIKVTFVKKNGGISSASNAALALATGEFIGFLDHDDELKPDALYEVVKLLNQRPDLDFIYTDEDKRSPDGCLEQPFFKPDWSPDLLLSENYVPHFAVYRRRIVDEVGGLRSECDFSQDYDLALRVTERTDRIAHVPLPLYTWRMIPGSAALEPGAKPKAVDASKRALADAMQRRGLDAEVLEGPVPNTYRVRYRIKGQPLVSIVIPTRNRVELLRPCIASIEKKTTYPNYEIIIVDNDSRDEATLDYLKKSPHRCLRYAGPFHYASMMNFAVREAAGEHVILLNNDTEVITPDWVEAMLEHSQRPEVAAVGARLLYPDGRVQHEGIIMGLGGGSALNADHRGYFGLGELVMNCSAVTGACMMARREVFEQMGGFDKNLEVAFNDVDFCLRARQQGYLVVFTPFAVLYHHESATRGRLHPEENEQFFRRRWGKPGEYRDPYYNPNLSLVRPFTIDV